MSCCKNRTFRICERQERHEREVARKHGCAYVRGGNVTVVEVNVKNNSPKVIRNIILGIQLYYLLTIKRSAKTLLRRTYQTSCLLLASVIH